MKERNSPWAIVCSASGFTGPTIVKLAKDKKEAAEKYKTAMKDFTENNWSHDREPTLYRRVEPIDVLEQLESASTNSKPDERGEC